MEIRIENTITLRKLEDLKKLLDDFFNVDFNLSIEGTYSYFRDN